MANSTPLAATSTCPITVHLLCRARSLASKSICHQCDMCTSQSCWPTWPHTHRHTVGIEQSKYLSILVLWCIVFVCRTYPPTTSVMLGGEQWIEELAGDGQSPIIITFVHYVWWHLPQSYSQTSTHNIPGWPSCSCKNYVRLIYDMPRCLNIMTINDSFNRECRCATRYLTKTERSVCCCARFGLFYYIMVDGRQIQISISSEILSVICEYFFVCFWTERWQSTVCMGTLWNCPHKMNK